MVDPTNVKLLFRRSLLRASDSGVIEGISLRDLNACLICFPPTYLQAYLSKEPNSFCIFRNSFASGMAVVVFAGVFIFLGFGRSLSKFSFCDFKILSGCIPWEALSYV